jgi:microcystin-dependent protein
MPLFLFSKTAAPNGVADPSIPCFENQSPSSINDGIRGLLAALAQYRDDVSGSLLTGGISTAYTLTTNSNFTSAAFLNGQEICFTPSATNGAGPVTLTLDAIANVPLRSSPSQELPAGTLIAGSPYRATYNNADGAFYLQSFFGNPFTVPIGGMIDFIGATSPNPSFVLPTGQLISRVTYAKLFAMIGSTYSAGDGINTFGLPDLRGRISVPADNMGGTSAGRVNTAGSGIDGTTLGATGGAQNVDIAHTGLPNVAPTFAGSTVGVSGLSGDLVTASSLFGGVPGSGGPGESLNGGNVVTDTLTVVAAGTIDALNGNVTQTAMKTVPPLFVATKLLRII